MALALAVALLIDTVVEQGLGEALVQRDELSGDFAGSVLIYQVVLAVVIAALLFVGAPLIAGLLSEPRLATVLPWIGLACVFNSLGFVRQALYRRALQFKVLAFRNFIATSVAGLLGLWFAYQGAGLMSLLVMHVTNAALGAAVLWIAKKPSFNLRFHLASLRELFNFSKSVLGVRLLEVLSSRLDQILVGQYFGAAVLGYYALAVRLYEILIQTTAAPVAEVAYPLFSRLQNDKSGLGQAYLRLLQYAGGLTIPLFVGAAVTAPTFIPVLFGTHWQPAIPYLVLILAFGAINSISTYNDVLFGSIGRPDLRLKLAVVGIGLWLCSAFLLLPLGPLYVAITWCIRAGAMYPLRLFFALRLMDIKLRRFLAVVLPQIGACVSMMGVIVLIGQIPSISAAVQLVTEILLGVSAYLVVLHLLDSPLPRQIFRMRQAING